MITTRKHGSASRRAALLTCGMTAERPFAAPAIAYTAG